MVFGETTAGADWCVKALHPSDPLAVATGIPDLNAVPSMMMNYQATYTVSPEASATGAWSFDAVLLPHPIQPLYVKKVDSITPLGELNAFLNPQIEGATHAAKYLKFLTLARRWRLAYMSVTVKQDGPDLANQGTIVASQVPVAPALYPCCFLVSNGIFTGPLIARYGAHLHPDFVTSQAMPNAYFNRSKEGCYMPLKLTETSQDWCSEENQHYVCNNANRTNEGAITIFNNNDPAFPFVTLQPFVGNTTTFYGGATAKLMNGLWGNISARNLAPTTSYSFFIRMGVEMQVGPASALAPQLRLAPVFDRKALETYFALSRELKDAYPEVYNAKGELWDAIGDAIRRISPHLRILAGPRSSDAGLILGVERAAKNYPPKRKARQQQPSPVKVNQPQSTGRKQKKKQSNVKRETQPKQPRKVVPKAPQPAVNNRRVRRAQARQLKRAMKNLQMAEQQCPVEAAPSLVPKEQAPEPPV
jgi:hypothetical protein